MSALLDVYPRLDLDLVHAEGSTLVLRDGRRIADLYGGHAVCPLGHGHPELTETLARAHATLDFFSNSLRMAIQEEAARAVLGDDTHLTAVHFVNSGTEANESALHVARRMTGRETIVCLDEGFHGRTFGSLSVTGLHGYRARLGCKAPAHWTRTITLNHPGAIEAIDEHTAGVLLESVPSLGGVHLPDPAWLQAIAARCREVGALLLFDEVQGGIGRLGTWFGHQAMGIRPDVVTLAKSLGSGFPVGAMVVGPEVAAWAKYGELGTTFGGGPMACAMVEATARIIRRDGLMDRVGEIFARVEHGLADLPNVHVRGRGALIGVETPLAAGDLQKRLLARDLMVGTSSHPKTLRLLPAYNLPFEAIDRFVSALHDVLHEVALA